MPTTYTLPDGTVRTTCGEHRTKGYTLNETPLRGKPMWVCRGCGEAEALHETTTETLARKAGEES